MSKIITLFILLTPFFAYSAEEAFFRPLSRTQIEIKEGDSFNGVIELWNIKNVSSEMIKKIQGNSFLDDFYAVSIERPKWSEDNPEVVLIEGIFILKNQIKNEEKIWSLGGLKIPIKIKEIKSEALTKKNNKFLIMDGNYEFDDSDKRLYWIVTAVIILLLLIILRIVLKSKNAVVVRNEKEVNWKLEIENAKSKEDFLYLYMNRESWIKEDNITVTEFVKLCNDSLFKKELEDFELDQLVLMKENLIKVVS